MVQANTSKIQPFPISPANREFLSCCCLSPVTCFLILSVTSLRSPSRCFTIISYSRAKALDFFSLPGVKTVICLLASVSRSSSTDINFGALSTVSLTFGSTFGLCQYQALAKQHALR